MLTLKGLKELILMVESGVSDEVIGNVLKIQPKKVKTFYKKGKKVIAPKGTDEADAGGGSSGTAAPSQPTSNKWSGAQHGRANPIDQNHKWESGLTRSKANQLS